MYKSILDSYNGIHVHLQEKQQRSIHQVITMLDTSKNVLFQGHNHLLTTGLDDSSL